MFVCYNYPDNLFGNFLYLCTETPESHTCLKLAKTSSIMENLFLMDTLKSTRLHCSLQPRAWVE